MPHPVVDGFQPGAVRLGLRRLVQPRAELVQYDLYLVEGVAQLVETTLSLGAARSGRFCAALHRTGFAEGHWAGVTDIDHHIVVGGKHLHGTQLVGDALGLRTERHARQGGHQLAVCRHSRVRLLLAAAHDLGQRHCVEDVDPLVAPAVVLRDRQKVLAGELVGYRLGPPAAFELQITFLQRVDSARDVAADGRRTRRTAGEFQPRLVTLDQRLQDCHVVVGVVDEALASLLSKR